MKDHQEMRKFTKVRMGEIAWRLILELGLRIPPDQVLREIGNLSKRIKVEEEKLKNFARDLVSVEWDEFPVFILSDKERFDVSLKFIKEKYSAKSEKLGPEEAKRARAAMARRINVRTEVFEQFTAELMKELYREALDKAGKNSRTKVVREGLEG